MDPEEAEDAEELAGRLSHVCQVRSAAKIAGRVPCSRMRLSKCIQSKNFSIICDCSPATNHTATDAYLPFVAWFGRLCCECFGCLRMEDSLLAEVQLFLAALKIDLLNLRLLSDSF